MEKKVNEGATDVEKLFVEAVTKASDAILDLSKVWEDLMPGKLMTAVDAAYEKHLGELPSFDDFSYEFLMFRRAVLDAAESLKEGKLDEATAPEFARLGRYVKGMAVPGSSRISDELFDLVDRENGVHERSLVAFFRGRGQLTTVDEEDIMEIEDLIDRAWMAGRKARGMRDTGVERDTSFRA